MRDALLKQVHAVVLVGRLHLAVHDHRHVLRRRERLRNTGITVLKVFIIHFFGFLDQRIDDVDLTAFLNLVADETEHLQPVRIAVVQRPDRLAARRQFVDHRHVQVAVQRHRQRTRDRRSGHYQHVRRPAVFVPQPRPLLDAETVLLVDHHEPEVFELHRILDQRMGPDQNMHVAGKQVFGQRRPLRVDPVSNSTRTPSPSSIRDSVA